MQTPTRLGNSAIRISQAALLAVMLLAPAGRARSQMLLGPSLALIDTQFGLESGHSRPGDGDFAKDLAWLSAGLPLLFLMFHHPSAHAPGNVVSIPPLEILPGGTASNGSWGESGTPPSGPSGPGTAGPASTVPEPGILVTLTAPAAAFALSMRQRRRR